MQCVLRVALKEALLMCDNRNLHQIKGTRVTRIQADGGGEFTNKQVRDLCWEKNIVLSYSPAHQPSSNGIAERMVGMLKTTVRRMLPQSNLGREWWSYACRFAGRMMRERVLGRDWTYPLFGQLVGIWKSHDKAQAKSLDDRGSVGYLLDIDIWQRGTTRIMQDGVCDQRSCTQTSRSKQISAYCLVRHSMTQISICHGEAFKMSLASSSGWTTKARSIRALRTPLSPMPAPSRCLSPA